MKITWLGHGTFQIVLPSGETLILDPWIEGNPKYPKDHKIERVDTMLISHGHFDHIHDALPLAKKFSPQIGAIYEICTWLEKKGAPNTKPMNKGGSQKIGSVNITMTHAIHSCGIQDGDQIIYGGEAAGFIVGFDDGRTAYFSGDTNVFTDMQLIQQLYRPELAFLPIGGLFTMSPYEAAAACAMLKVKKVIPMHYGTFPGLTGTPEDFAQRIQGTGTDVWKLEPGQAVEW